MKWCSVATGKEKCSSVDYMKYLSENLYSMFEEQQQCDVTLISSVDGTSVSAHRLILCAASEYFHVLLNSPLRESTNSNDHEIGGICGDTLRALVTYCYTAKIEITEKNVLDILAAASLFLLGHVKQICEQFLIQQIELENCIGMWLLAENYVLEALNVEASTMIADNFIKLTTEEEYLSLKPDELTKILKLNHLYVWRESFVFEALVQWVKHDESKRMEHFPRILPAIRFNQMPIEYLTKNCSEYFLRWCCMDLFEKIIEQHTVNGVDIPVVPRKTLTDPMLFMVHLMNINASDCELQVSKFNDISRKWRVMCRVDGLRHRFGTARIGHHLYIIGGTRKYTYTFGNTDEVQRVNMITWKVKRMKRLRMERGTTHTAVLNNTIYVFSAGTNRAERYDVETNAWSWIAPLPSDADVLGVTVCLNQLYVQISSPVRRLRILCYVEELNDWIDNAIKSDGSISDTSQYQVLINVPDKLCLRRHRSMDDAALVYDFDKENWSKDEEIIKSIAEKESSVEYWPFYHSMITVNLSNSDD